MVVSLPRQSLTTASLSLSIEVPENQSQPFSCVVTSITDPKKITAGSPLLHRCIQKRKLTRHGVSDEPWCLHSGGFNGNDEDGKKGFES
ncbi:hypothetical protein PVL29_024607 [Vitis rotundifolia]|uniref:Uncharacterized protein n=1 Tax=Vitis rotundifolia TaxID=103349 RepID=A0AA39D9L5_VITRO|nr:hypothetical protein PVL29_024607 [Vitis rotundifolia]